MSRRARGALVALALVTLSVRVDAQSVPDLEARVASARESLLDALARQDSSRGELDSIHVGTLRIFVHPSARSRAEEAAREAWISVRRQLGSDTSMVRGLAIHINNVARTTFSGGVVTVSVSSGSSEPMRGGQFTQVVPLAVGDDHTATQIAWSIERVIFNYVYNSIERQDVRTWLGGPTSFDSVRVGEWTSTYIDLATASFGIADRCFRNDLSECKDALWLGLSDSPNSVWYSLEEAQMLARWQGNLESSQCAAAISTQACLAWLDGQPPRPPLSTSARQTLFRLAISSGDDGAVARFFAPAERIEDRLAAAAGMPIDRLLQSWIDHVLAAPPDQTALPIRSASMATVWILTLLALASRSSRWR